MLLMDKSTSWVAIVDDEKMVRRAILRVLRLENIAAREFSGGASFLKALDSDLPHCVLLDIVMPEMSGLEVLSRIRQRTAELPVILMSGNITPSSRLIAEPDIRAHFLQKPFHASVLIDAVRSVGCTASEVQCGTFNRFNQQRPDPD